MKSWNKALKTKMENIKNPNEVLQTKIETKQSKLIVNTKITHYKPKWGKTN